MDRPPTRAETAIRAAAAAVPSSVRDAVQIVVGDELARRDARRVELAEATLADATDPEAIVDRLRTDEYLARVFLDAINAAGRTHLDAKRRLLARVVARAADDDTEVDEAALVVEALRELDAPHLRALERIRAAEDRERAIHDREEDLPTYERVPEAVRRAAGGEPLPIRSALIRVGVVIPAAPLGGGVAIVRVSQFGRRLLDDLRDAEPETRPDAP